jgi:hypothetical protein
MGARQPERSANGHSVMKACLLTAFILFGVLALEPYCVGNAQGISPTTGLTTATINDPSFGGMKAFTVTLPSGWQFQGTVIASLRCSLPSPVFRAYSPDGLTEMRLMPSFNWDVQDKSRSDWEGLGVPPDCVYLNETLTAAQFLDRYVRTLGGAHVVGPMNISAAFRQQLDQLLSQMNANKSSDPKMSMTTTGDAAALRIETVNGTFAIEQRLRARVICTLWPKPLAGIDGNCSARVDVLRAPKGQLDVLVALVDGHNLTTAKHDDRWLSAVMARMGLHGAKPPFDPPHPDRAALAMVYRQAKDFGLTEELERSRMYSTEPLEHRYRQMELAPDAIGGSVPDWADFALEPRPKVSDDGLVQLGIQERKWSNSSGQWYRTRYPNADPNGTLPGKWVADTSAGNWIGDMKFRGESQPQ